MSSLHVTLIDVGWGDSILIESIGESDNSKPLYALVDSPDTPYLQSSYIFLKRHFEKKGVKIPEDKPLFEFVLLSHPHTDHYQGLKTIMKEFGTRNFWYPKSTEWGSAADLIRFAGVSSNVQHHQSIDDTKIIPKLGDVDIAVLWPVYNQPDSSNENNNSVVLSLRLGNVVFVLSGDAEAEVWSQISGKLSNARFFKIPHHGSINGTFDSHGNTPWLSSCPNACLGISSHVRPFGHPNQQVVQLLDSTRREYYRTDQHYHITVQTDGTDVEVKYSHV
jgi:competence protein ComEC